jgi:thiol-disulfide isomerase/thioredoxin
MKTLFHRLLMLLIILLLPISLLPASASEMNIDEGICPPDTVSNADACSEAPTTQLEQLLFDSPSEKGMVQESQDKDLSQRILVPQKLPDEKGVISGQEIVVYFFWGKGCPHCEKEKLFLKEMKKKYQRMVIKDYEVWYHKENAQLLLQMAKAYNMKASGVPVTCIGGKYLTGFSEQIKTDIEEIIRKCSLVKCVDPKERLDTASDTYDLKNKPERKSQIIAEPPAVVRNDDAQRTLSESEKNDDCECRRKSRMVSIPLVGKVDTSEMSLPFITFIIAGLDSFNPCAFFVLFSLLGLLVHAQSRKKMLLIGGIFVFFSGFIYFTFMAAWLNLFLFMGQVALITRVAGIISIVIASINIKDYFAFKKGVSLTIPESAQPKLFDRMRRLLKSTSLLSILIGTVILAIAANSYELLCTAGFPIVFTRILTLNNLPSLSYYLYLIFYNVVYIVPLTLIVIIFTITLGKKKLTEWQGRVLKLVSGTMMLGLGVVLLINPSLLHNIIISFLLLVGTIAVCGIIVFITKHINIIHIEK